MSAVGFRSLAIARRHAFRRSYATTPAGTAQETAASAAAKAQETAANVAAKAQEIFNKGVAAAGPVAAKLSESAVNAVNKAPGRGNSLINAVQGLIPHAVYYGKVAAELGKHVYRGQQMSPPSLEALQKFYAPYVAPLLQPANYWTHIKTIRPRIAALPDPQTAVERVMAVPRKDLAQYAVYAAEFVGFFTVGTMIGKRKIVGYRGGVKDHH